MNFDAFYSQSFLSLICDVYNLKIINPLGSKGSSTNAFPLLMSSKPFKSRLAFNLPFGFYQTAEKIQQLITFEDWEKICLFSGTSGINVTLTSIGELNFRGGIYQANNPILDLKKSETFLEIYSKNHRQNVIKERNKLAKKNLNIVVTNSKNDLFQFYDLMANQYVKDHRMVFQPFSLFDGLISNGLAELIVLKHIDQVVGGMLCIRDFNVFHYNWGVRGKFENLSIGTLLIDFAITYAKSKGCDYFDFGSTPLSDTLLFNYKMKWGCDNHKIFKYYSLKELRQIDLNSSYSTARKLYSKLPIPVAKKLMPILVPWLVS
jgi:hypothetical protein